MKVQSCLFTDSKNAKSLLSKFQQGQLSPNSLFVFTGNRIAFEQLEKGLRYAFFGGDSDYTSSQTIVFDDAGGKSDLRRSKDKGLVLLNGQKKDISIQDHLQQILSLGVDTPENREFSIKTLILKRSGKKIVYTEATNENSTDQEISRQLRENIDALLLSCNTSAGAAENLGLTKLESLGVPTGTGNTEWRRLRRINRV